VEVLLPRDVKPVVKDGKIEVTLFRFDLVPGHRHQHGVEVHLRQLRQDCVRLRRGSGGRIADFAAQNQKRIAANYKLGHTIPASHGRQLLSRQCCRHGEDGE
jgi:hypothetical protein